MMQANVIKFCAPTGIRTRDLQIIRQDSYPDNHSIVCHHLVADKSHATPELHKVWFSGFNSLNRNVCIVARRQWGVIPECESNNAAKSTTLEIKIF